MQWQSVEMLLHLAHEGQTRADGVTPYVTHPREVCRRAMLAGMDVEMQQVALLHDTIEDSEGAVTFEVLEANGASRRQIDMLAYLTRGDAESYGEFIDRMVQGIARGDPEARDAARIKLLDIAHNLDDDSSANPPWVKRIRSRYEKARERLETALR